MYMKNWITKLICIFLPLASMAMPPEETMVVEVNGIKHPGGQIGVRVFRNDSEMFDNPFRVVHAPNVNGKVIVEIDQLTFGDYAIVAYHDENNNQQLDHNALGFPKESLGYSGDYHFGLFSGMPTFAKLKIKFSHQAETIKISID